ncbi:hypothetical protein EVAR_8533_1 [Eumeta japonica]|uniref:Uncharacterized protein n=1 Tax=Eumeta variegata TaxID=151549 RepID=A0A4C1TXR6_EUMVA|nr:hypothetical protein EVAR_8533_1 [Eumeta japonica]
MHNEILTKQLAKIVLFHQDNAPAHRAAAVPGLLFQMLPSEYLSILHIARTLPQANELVDHQRVPKWATPTLGHSQPQRSHQRLVNLLDRNGISDEGRIDGRGAGRVRGKSTSSSTTHSPLRQPTPPTMRSPIPTQEAGNALVTLLELQVSMGGGAHPLCAGGPPSRADRRVKAHSEHILETATTVGTAGRRRPTAADRRRVSWGGQLGRDALQRAPPPARRPARLTWPPLRP